MRTPAQKANNITTDSKRPRTRAQPERPNPAALGVFLANAAATAAEREADRAAAAVVGGAGNSGPAGGDGASNPASPEAVQARLGPGQPLDASTRARMERGFGRSFGDVRVHTDPAAAEITRELNARAFAVGTDIGFAAGQYQPGTLRGDLLIAHELAHVVQQRGARGAVPGETALERSATTSGVRAVAAARPDLVEEARDRAHLPDLSGPVSPIGGAGLRLQRCGYDEVEVEEEDVEEAVVPTELEPPLSAEPQAGPAGQTGQVGQAAQPGQAGQANQVAQPGVTTSAEMIDLSDIEWEPVQDATTVLMIRGPDQSLYALPARGLVYQPVATPQGQPRAALGLPAAGHAGIYLVRTNRGVGMLVDAGGTRSGRPNVLLPGSLAVLSARMGIRQILGALISHTHSDHVANFQSLVDAGLVTGNRVYVYPGWETATRGPLAAVYRAMRDPSYANRGFGPAWQPTTITTRDVSGVTQASLRIGDAQFEIITRSADLQRYVAELRAGRTGGRFADAASMLTRIRLAGASFDFTIIGDIRGSTIAQLHDTMGQRAFNQFFANTRVLGGFQHHLGAVNNARDVQGMIHLLRAAQSANFQLTILVQTDAGRNQTLIQQLQEAGARVVVLGDIDPSRPTSIAVDPATGQVRPSGRAQTFDPSPVTQQARSRIENLLRAAEVLESHPQLIRVQGATHQQMAAGLRAEAQRLSNAVYARQELALRETHRSTRRADYAARLAANTQAIESVQGMEANLGRDTIRMLRRLHQHAAEIQREMESARARGRASHRLAQLYAQVDPNFARQVLADEFGRATGERGLLRAQRRAEHRLRQRIEWERSLFRSSGARVGRGPRAVAAGLALLEIFHQVAPLISMGIERYRSRREKDFYTFLTIASWWHEKGVPVPVRGRRDDTEVPATENLSPSIVRRVWEDLPSSRRVSEEDLDEEVRTARPLQALWIPAMRDWDSPESVWDAFRIWASIHVNTFDDYAAEFLDVPNPAIRKRPDSGNFGAGEWEVRTGVVDEDGHVDTRWEHSPELTRIMRATELAAIRGTEAEIQAEWEARHQAPAYEPPAIFAPGTRRPRPQARGIARTRFKGGGTKPVFAAFRKFANPRLSHLNEWHVIELTRYHFIGNDPYFTVDERESAPPGYVVVRGADYDTHASIRTQDTWFDDPNDVVYLQKPVTGLHEVLPRRDRSPREQRALDAVTRGRALRFNYPSSVRDPSYEAEVHFPYKDVNVSGRIYVRRSDLQEPFER